MIVFDFRVLSLVDLNDLKLSFENRSVCLPLPQLHAPQGSFDIDIDACMIMYVLFFHPLHLPKSMVFSQFIPGSRDARSCFYICWGRSYVIPLPSRHWPQWPLSRFRTSELMIMNILIVWSSRWTYHQWSYYLYISTISILISTDLSHILYHEHIWIPLFYSQFFKLVKTHL